MLMAAPASPRDTGLLARIAWHYYRDGKTQEEIGRLLGMSRQRVLRALSQARELGIVQIRVEHPAVSCLELEARLKQVFGLPEAVVVPAPASARPAVGEVGRAAADYLVRIVRPGDVLGTAWGRTVHHVVQHLPRKVVPGLKVVLLLGALAKGPAGMDTFDLAQGVADHLGATCTFVYAPAIVDSAEIRAAIVQDSTIRAALGLARHATKAILGIGDTTDQAALIQAGLLTPAMMAALRARGAAGDILARFFDTHGRPLRSELDDRIIGLDLDALRQIPMKIAVAHGPTKVAAILGALRGRHIDVLITDEGTAAAVLACAGVAAR